MPDGPDVIYSYDGSYEGFMCCVFESFEKREIPGDIIGPEQGQLTLFMPRQIVTDEQKARRVMASIPLKIDKEAPNFLRRAFLTCLPHKEKHMLDFMRKGYRVGAKIMNMLQDATVHKLFKAVQNLGGEAHLLTGFLRFSIHGGVLVARITPKNFVLPLLAPHFVDRYPNEKFIIYDKTHNTVLLHEPGRLDISSVETFTMPAPDEEERLFRELWKMFYDTIAVEGRTNHRCRMTHMPKRYWENMTEFAGYD